MVGPSSGQNAGTVKTPAVGKGRVIRPLLSWLDADLVVYSKSELLFAAEVMFRRLGGHVTEEELDLVEFAAGQMAETRTCASQIVERQHIYSGGLGRSLDDLPKAPSASCPWRQIFPDLLMALNRQPSLIPLASVQRSSASFTQTGIGTV